MTTLDKPARFNDWTTAEASSRRGSSIQMTAASFPSIARYRWEYSFGSASNFACSPSGITQFSSSNTKCALPITARFSLIVEAIPCATMYSTLLCISSCSRFFCVAASTTAFAMEWGKCSSKHAAIRSSSSVLSPLNDITSTTVGFALVSVPVLSNTMVSASATASKYLPPFTVTL